MNQEERAELENWLLRNGYRLREEPEGWTITSYLNETTKDTQTHRFDTLNEIKGWLRGMHESRDYIWVDNKGNESQDGTAHPKYQPRQPPTKLLKAITELDLISPILPEDANKLKEILIRLAQQNKNLQKQINSLKEKPGRKLDIE